MTHLSEQELEEWTRKANDGWEFRFKQKTIARKRRGWFVRAWHAAARPLYRIPCQALYRLAKETWVKDPFASKFPFPFDGQTVGGIFKLNDGWAIFRRDLKFLHEGPLYAADGRTELVGSKVKWHQTLWGWLLRGIAVPIIVGVIVRLAG